MIRKRPIPQRTLEQEFSNAVQKSNTRNMEALLERGINLHAEYDVHPIFFDASLPHLRILLRHGLDINVPSSYNGMTMLNYLCYSHNRWNPNSNHTELITFLLEQGADTLLTDFNGDTPLHNLCTKYIDPVVLRLLLRYGADPTLSNNQGDTPLHMIGGNQVSIPGLPYAECIRILVEAGANPLEKNEDGQTPSEYAEAMRAKYEILQALIQAERNAGSQKEMPEEPHLPPFIPNEPYHQYHNQQNMFNGGSGRRKNRKTRRHPRRRRQAHKKRTHRRR